MYDLTTTGQTDLARYTSLLSRTSISLDGMSGVVDGTNTIFTTSFHPLLTSGSLTCYNASGSVIAVTTVDYDAGVVTLPVAPSSFQPRASYTFTPFTTSERMSMLISGFWEMQSRWPRDGWYLSSGSSMYASGDETSTNLYIVYKQATGSVVDPPCSSTTVFSGLPAQLAFYMACCEYAYLSRQLVETSLGAIEFREMRGTLVNRSNIPKHIAVALDNVNKNVLRKMQVAKDEYYDGTTDYVGFSVSAEHSDQYDNDFDWRD